MYCNAVLAIVAIGRRHKYCNAVHAIVAIGRWHKYCNAVLAIVAIGRWHKYCNAVLAIVAIGRWHRYLHCFIFCSVRSIPFPSPGFEPGMSPMKIALDRSAIKTPPNLTEFLMLLLYVHEYAWLQNSTRAHQNHWRV